MPDAVTFHNVTVVQIDNTEVYNARIDRILIQNSSINSSKWKYNTEIFVKRQEF